MPLDAENRSFGLLGQADWPEVNDQTDLSSAIDRVTAILGRDLPCGPDFLGTEHHNHLRRTGHYAAVLGTALNWPRTLTVLTALATPLHDIGKLAIPSEILEKPGGLSAEEAALVRRHAIIGYEELARWPHPILRHAAVIALSHHERWDGSGYPAGLRGPAIPIAGRVAGLADTYDALRMARSYKRAYTHERAIRVILEGDGRTEPQHFDPDLLTIFARAHHRFREIYEAFSDPGSPLEMAASKSGSKNAMAAA